MSNKISEIVKGYKENVETARKAEIEARYREHYGSVMLPHLKELENAYNNKSSEMREVFEKQKSDYIAAQKKTIEDEVNAEYEAFLRAMKQFSDDKED